MAEVRKSAKQTAARERAREKAAEFREKQDKLEQLATDYFVAADLIDEIEANVDKAIADARARGAKETVQARKKEAGIVSSMLDLGVPRSEVAGRLGIPTRDVKKTGTATSSPVPDDSPTPNTGDDAQGSNESGGAAASE
jgi:hypothetical protein